MTDDLRDIVEKMHMWSCLRADRRAKGVTRSEWDVLEVLIASGGMYVRGLTTADIAQEIMGSEATVSRARHRLINRGLIMEYRPGKGHQISEYDIAPMWDWAEEAVKERASA